jgi:hypothetical protein
METSLSPHGILVRLYHLRNLDLRLENENKNDEDLFVNEQYNPLVNLDDSYNNTELLNNEVNETNDVSE